VRCDAVGDGRLDDRLDGWLEPWVAACGAEPAEPPHPTTLSATRPATVVCSRRRLTSVDATGSPCSAGELAPSVPHRGFMDAG
jgi:hypothetical protein